MAMLTGAARVRSTLPLTADNANILCTYTRMQIGFTNVPCRANIVRVLRNIGRKKAHPRPFPKGREKYTPMMDG